MAIATDPRDRGDRIRTGQLCVAPSPSDGQRLATWASDHHLASSRTCSISRWAVASSTAAKAHAGAASGRILEIGFGTGRNLPHYPPGVSRIEAIDPDTDLDRFSLPRIAASSVAVDFHHLNAEHLPFEGDSFDTVVCTLTLCSIPDVVHALGEVHRVLKPADSSCSSSMACRPMRRWPVGSIGSTRFRTASAAAVIHPGHGALVERSGLLCVMPSTITCGACPGLPAT